MICYLFSLEVYNPSTFVCSVIFTDVNICTWIVFWTSLSYDDVPAIAACPPKILTPKRFDSDSLPFLNYRHLSEPWRISLILLLFFSIFFSFRSFFLL
jgi:hypothetical protein